MAVRDIVQAAAGVGGGANPYIEDVFSTYLYTGNGSTQTITNGIDLAGEGGLVWTKGRSIAESHILVDTVRGVENNLRSNQTSAEFNFGTGYTVTAFNSDGYSIGSFAQVNQNLATFASWTFRKAPKFFDCVTYTGTGSAQNIAHNLGADVGCLIVKRLNTTENWTVWHRGIDGGSGAAFINLNLTSGYSNSATRWNNTAPTSTEFSVGTHTSVNASGSTYVAYLFAHDAGGFGDDGEQNVISCGSFTTNASGVASVDLGWEPQFVLYKAISRSGDNWVIVDDMRGFTTTTSTTRPLYPNTSDAEGSAYYVQKNTPSSNGFSTANEGSNHTYIYIAIRRGPMKTPESGTEVFSLATRTGNATQTSLTGAGFPPDLFISNERPADSGWRPWFDKLRGSPRFITPSVNFAAEVSNDTDVFKTFDQDGVTIGTDVANNGTNKNSQTYVNYFLRRSPKTFDICCYTGTGSAQAISHNLGVVPELIFVRCRSASNDWAVYAGDNTDYLLFNSTAATADDNTYWNDTAPTSSAFTVGTNADVNTSAATYVAYLFATLAGVTKVGTYTGTGTTLQINCGFSAGARFVLIKRTDSTGDWYMWDSARGIVSGDDPYITINAFYSSEVTNTDYIDPLASGFEISSTAPAAINASGGNFVFLAVA